MDFANLSTTELQDLLMDKTKQLTSAIREGSPVHLREDLRKQIQEIQQLLEASSLTKKDLDRLGRTDSQLT